MPDVYTEYYEFSNYIVKYNMRTVHARAQNKILGGTPMGITRVPHIYIFTVRFANIVYILVLVYCTSIVYIGHSKYTMMNVLAVYTFT